MIKIWLKIKFVSGICHKKQIMIWYSSGRHVVLFNKSIEENIEKDLP